MYSHYEKKMNIHKCKKNTKKEKYMSMEAHDKILVIGKEEKESTGSRRRVYTQEKDTMKINE